MRSVDDLNWRKKPFRSLKAIRYHGIGTSRVTGNKKVPYGTGIKVATRSRRRKKVPYGTGIKVATRSRRRKKVPYGTGIKVATKSRRRKTGWCLVCLRAPATLWVRIQIFPKNL
jgi:hypothetical protein